MDCVKVFGGLEKIGKVAGYQQRIRVFKMIPTGLIESRREDRQEREMSRIIYFNKPGQNKREFIPQKSPRLD